MRFLKLQRKDVVDMKCGKKIGYISDIEIDLNCFKIEGICIEKYTPYRLLCFFKAPPIIYIPVSHIISIGEDVIIVNID